VSAVTLFSADEGGNPHYWRASDHSTQRASNGNRKESAKMTFGQAAEIHLQNLDDNLRIKPRTRHYWPQRFAAFIKSWPRPGRNGDSQDYPRRVRKVGEHLPQNCVAVALLRDLLNVAIEAGAIYANPAATLKRTAIRATEIALPSTDKFNALLSEMRAAHSRDSHNCADFVLGLAVTGMRKGEANALEWRDVDFEAGEIVVRGDPETAIKN
jgi:integrase